TAEGQPDESFSPGGVFTVDFGGGDGVGTVTIQPDAKILLLGGTADTQPLGINFAAARLTEGSPGNPLPPVLVGGGPTGTAVVITPVGGTYELTGTVSFYPGLPIDVRTATADVNGDGTPDLIGGAGPGALPGIMVLDGRTG